MLEAAVIAWILTAGGRIRPALKTDDDVSRYVVAVTLGGLVAALVSMASLALDRGRRAVADRARHLRRARVVLVHPAPVLRGHRRPSRDRRTGSSGSCQWVVTLGVTVVVFLPADFPAMLFLVIPGLGWGALRSPLREVQLQLLVVVTIGTVLTTWGYGPLAEAPDRYALPEPTSPGSCSQSFFIACVLVDHPAVDGGRAADGERPPGAGRARPGAADREQRQRRDHRRRRDRPDHARSTRRPSGCWATRPTRCSASSRRMFHTAEEISRQAAAARRPRRLRRGRRSSWPSRTPARSTSSSCARTAPSAPTR